MMLEVICKYCSKHAKVKPSDIGDPHDYHCRDCHPAYLKDKNQRGEMKWDRTAYNKIKKLALLNGHAIPRTSLMEASKQ